MGTKNYRDLIAWQKAMDLAVQIYGISKLLPADERFGLVMQMRRAAASVPANIAEGEGRGGNVEFARFLRIAHGSLREVETHVILAGRLGFLDEPIVAETLERSSEVGKILMGLIRSLK